MFDNMIVDKKFQQDKLQHLHHIRVYNFARQVLLPVISNI
jgi:hypothetical protein